MLLYSFYEKKLVLTEINGLLLAFIFPDPV